MTFISLTVKCILTIKEHQKKLLGIDTTDQIYLKCTDQ